LSNVLEGEHAEGLASFDDDGQIPRATLLQEPINLPEELTFRGLVWEPGAGFTVL